MAQFSDEKRCLEGNAYRVKKKNQIVRYIWNEEAMTNIMKEMEVSEYALRGCVYCTKEYVCFVSSRTTRINKIYCHIDLKRNQIQRGKRFSLN